MSKKVVVLGGGIAGMSAAHELVERGFKVEVYEIKSIPGGKARSIPKLNSGVDGRKDLPGEHGFRFFPRFYKHVTDTMKRIPDQTTGKSVYDNLTQTSRLEIARFDQYSILVPYEQGLPWNENIPWFLDLLQRILISLRNIFAKLNPLLKKS